MISVWVSAEEDRSIKLGLGDFVFYSVLVSRAALFDISSMAASFISIIMVSVGDRRVLCPTVVPPCELCSHQVFPPPGC